MSVQGLRSPGLHGDTTQAVAENGVVTIAKNNSHLYVFKELVVVVDPRLHRLQRDQGLQMAAKIEEQQRIDQFPPETDEFPKVIHRSKPLSNPRPAKLRL